LDQLTSSQISEWEAYDRLDPIGTWRTEFAFARLSALIMNIVNKLYQKKGSTYTPVEPFDFMPNWSGEMKKTEIKQTVEEQKEQLLRIFKAQNKKLKK
jgi:hypothetical protein